MNEKLNIPGLKHLPNYQQEGPLPHVIVADEAFPLLHSLMRPGVERAQYHEMSAYSTIACQGQEWLLKMPLEYWLKDGGSLTEDFLSAQTMLTKLYKQLYVCIII